MSNNDMEIASAPQSVTYQAALALDTALNFWCELCVLNGLSEGGRADAERFFYAEIVSQMVQRLDSDGDSIARTLGGEDGRSLNLPRVMYCVIAYVVQALQANEAGEQGSAWLSVSNARYWAGALWGMWTSQVDGPTPAQIMAKKRHKETYGMRAYVEQFWRGNIDPKLSAQKAADLMVAANVVNLSHKKIAEIVAAVRKAEGLR